MRQMIWLTVSLSLLLATASASGVKEEKEELLVEDEQLRDEHQDDRELWYWVSSDDQQAGQRCGNRNHCVAGLECTSMPYGDRCTPQKSCLTDGLEAFAREVDIERLKQDMLREAGVSQTEVIDAAQGDEPGAALLRNKGVRNFITAVHRHEAVLDNVDSIFMRCSEDRRRLQTNPGSVPVSAPMNPERRLFNEPSAAPSMIPTKAPSSYPSVSPTLNSERTIYTGFSIEGGALVEGSVTVFWEKNSPLDFPPVYVKGCLGIGPLIGADLSLVTIIAESNDPQMIQCLSTMYDVDLHVGVGAGYGVGVCMLQEPTFIFQEIKFGAGIGFGASTFSVCDGEQIAQGFDDGLPSDSSDSKDGSGDHGNY